ncbi:MAG: NAD(P)/FAD-dependent oxidoreductase [Bacillota bacterium]
MSKTYDVAVIGGGIIGLSSAYYLAKAGKKVIVLEKNEIGSGASGACDDMILLQSKKPGILLEMAFESLEMYEGLSKELNYDIEFECRGGMILIEDQQQLDVMMDFVEQQKKWGLDVDIISKKEVRKKQPHVKKTVIASTYSKRDAQVNPLRVMRGFFANSVNMGVEIRKHIQIKSIEQRKDYWKILLYQGDAIEAENIINAAGAWAPAIGELIGVHIPISPKKGQIAITEKIPRLGESNVWSAEYIVAKLRPDLTKEKDSLHQKYGIGFAFAQASDGNYLLGSTRENVGFDKSTNYEAIRLMTQQALQFFPILKNVHIIRTIAGFRPATPDGKAIVGELDGRKGFYIAAGHEGDGIALAPITGKMMVDLVNREHIHYNVNELNLNRFGRMEEVKVC